MESIDKTLESVFQSMILIEETKDQILESLCITGDDSAGETPATDQSKLDGRIGRGDKINARLQHIHLDLCTIQGELEKI